MTHDVIAREIASTITTPRLAANTARQGDLLLRRLGPTTRRPPVRAIQLAAGSHGEHWAIGAAALAAGILDVGPAGVVVVHTDVPEARHAAIALAPGCWQIGIQRELGLDSVIRKVVD